LLGALIVAGSLVCLSTMAIGCSKKTRHTFITTGSASTGKPTASTHLDATEALPGVVLNAAKVSGASGKNGAFQVGDHPALTFTLARNDGSGLPLSELDGSEVFLSGPSFNYQRVFA